MSSWEFPSVSPEIYVGLLHLSSVNVTLVSGTFPGFVTVYVYVTGPGPAGKFNGDGTFLTLINGAVGAPDDGTTGTAHVGTVMTTFAFGVVTVC